MIICYGFKAIDEENATWFEIYFYKKQVSLLSLANVKKAIIDDIDERTNEKILSGFVYKDNDGIDRNVWLSAENQRNYSEAQRIADKVGADNYEPTTFKIGEDEEGRACYKTFGTLDELNQFYVMAFSHIKQCLFEGWNEKDNIDFKPYEQYFQTGEETSLTDGPVASPSV